ncbi:MAG: DUF1801 domain-containing protein [Pseudomonadaceae bacterium]|nr:DUF1801 domain-containing protein [Pseudomonadaceae bacterium]
MAKIKTVQNTASVNQYIASLADEHKRKDGRKIVKLMRLATQDKPMMWGDKIVGCGKHHYTYADGKPGEICNVGFAPRARSFAFYLANFPGRDKLLAKLGKHKFSGGCLHISKLEDVDEKVLETIIKKAYLHGLKSGA